MNGYPVILLQVGGGLALFGIGLIITRLLAGRRRRDDRLASPLRPIQASDWSRR